MDTDIIVAVIALIEAIAVVLFPYLLNRFSQKKSKAITREKILPYFTNTSGNQEIDAEIDHIYEQALESFGVSSYTSVYLRQYKASIELFVDGDCMTVKSAYTLCFVNPYRIDYTFKRKPMLRLGKQYDTYEWTSVEYQGTPCLEYIRSYPENQKQTPNGRYKFKKGIEIPLSKEQVVSVLRFASEYQVEGANFFNSYKFWHHCKMFDIDVRLTGPDASKYELQWEIFLSTNHRSNNTSRSVHANEANHVSLSDGGWIFPGDGYVVTLTKVTQ